MQPPVLQDSVRVHFEAATATATTDSNNVASTLKTALKKWKKGG